MFDLTVTRRDPKTGAVSEENPYIMKIGPEGTVFERPPHSGKHYDITGKLVKDTSPETLAAKAAAEKAAAEELAKSAKKGA